MIYTSNSGNASNDEDAGVFQDERSNDVGPSPGFQKLTHYKMDHCKRGLAFIFNHVYFTVDNLGHRSSSTVDCATLSNTLKDFGFEVQVFDNNIFKDVKTNLESARMDHSNHDCLVIAVLTHGDLGVLYAKDSSYDTDIIWSYFTSDKCPSLGGKPKLFFIQACQGEMLDNGCTLKDRVETDGAGACSRHQGQAGGIDDRVNAAYDKTKHVLPKMKSTLRLVTHPDFLIAFSTIPGYRSWRNSESGSWFIQTLCKELHETGTRNDLLMLLTFVSKSIAINFESMTPDDPEISEMKQIPCITSTLTRLVQLTRRSESPTVNDNVPPCGGV